MLKDNRHQRFTTLTLHDTAPLSTMSLRRLSNHVDLSGAMHEKRLVRQDVGVDYGSYAFTVIAEAIRARQDGEEDFVCTDGGRFSNFVQGEAHEYEYLGDHLYSDGDGQAAMRRALLRTAACTTEETRSPTGPISMCALATLSRRSHPPLSFSRRSWTTWATRRTLSTPSRQLSSCAARHPRRWCRRSGPVLNLHSLEPWHKLAYWEEVARAMLNGALSPPPAGEEEEEEDLESECSSSQEGEAWGVGI